MSLVKRESHWIPLADLMTVLMITFLFITVCYMLIVSEQKKKEDKLFEDFRAAKVGLYNKLDSVFKNDTARWNLKLDRDLSIKFTKPQVLFEEGKSTIKPEFKEILNEFLPKYLEVVLDKEFTDNIAEIRIEGHTNSKALQSNQVCNFSNDSYIDNMELSQNRARNVLSYLRSIEYFKGLNDSQKNVLQYWLTANGLSYGRTVDSKDSLTYFTKQSADDDKSRRVEFRIITNSEDLINKKLQNIK